MDHYVGLDVSLEETCVCVIDQEGKKLWQGKTSSEPTHIAKLVKNKAPDAVMIGFEAGPLSTWHWHELKNMGLPVVCLDARHAKAALSMQLNKTDANDAFGLAQIVRTGWYREVKVKSMDAHLIKTLLIARSNLVQIRTKITNQTRGILKTFGLVLGKASGAAFKERVNQLTKDELELDAIIQSLLAVWERACLHIELMDKQIRAFTTNNQDCKRLMTIPGVGHLTAMAYMAVIDDPKRFKKSSSVGAYLGLTPRRYKSGEVDISGRISKCGNAMMRSYLFEAANVILTRTTKWSKLKAWAAKLAKKTGAKKAKVALARKLAVIMHRMWIDGSDFRWTDKATA